MKDFMMDFMKTVVKVDVDEARMDQCLDLVMSELKQIIAPLVASEYFIQLADYNNADKFHDVAKRAIKSEYNVLDYKTSPADDIMFVEDGSVDVQELERALADAGRNVKVIVYRQGSALPTIVSVDK